jgi:hypothetical protein
MVGMFAMSEVLRFAVSRDFTMKVAETGSATSSRACGA